MSQENRVQQERKRRRWTLTDAELACEIARARVDRKTIWRIEHALVKPRRSTIIRLAKGYGMSSRRLWELAEADWADKVLTEHDAREAVG
jgi:transcriptional regulator with XRE-family HTH domain